MPAFPGSGGGSGRGGGSSFGSGGGGGGGGYGGGGGGYGGGGYNSSGGRGRGRGSKGGKGSSKGGKGSSWGGGSSRGRGGKGGSSSQLPTKQAVLQGHTQTVTCLAVRESAKQLFSGSMDGTVRVWSWEQQFQCVHTVNAAGPVETILVFDDWLFAGTSASNGRQGVVNVWHMVNGFEQMLEGHQGAVWCLAQGGAYLFSGGDDMGVKTWQFGETQKFEPVVNLSGHTAPIQCMTATGNVLLSAEGDAADPLLRERGLRRRAREHLGEQPVGAIRRPLLPPQRPPRQRRALPRRLRHHRPPRQGAAPQRRGRAAAPPRRQ